LTDIIHTPPHGCRFPSTVSVIPSSTADIFGWVCNMPSNLPVSPSRGSHVHFSFGVLFTSLVLDCSYACSLLSRVQYWLTSLIPHPMVADSPPHRSDLVSDGHDLEVDQVDFQGLGRKSATSRRPGAILSLRVQRSLRARGERSIYSVLSAILQLHSWLLAPSVTASVGYWGNPRYSRGDEVGYGDDN
jgi:hypothetical protein